MKSDLKDLQKLVVLNTKVTMEMVGMVAHHHLLLNRDELDTDDLVRHLKNLDDYAKLYVERYKP